MDILTYINKMNRLYGNDPTPVRFNTRQYLQGGRVGLKPGGLVEPGVMHYGIEEGTLTKAEIDAMVPTRDERRKLYKENNLTVEGKPMTRKRKAVLGEDLYTQIDDYITETTKAGQDLSRKGIGEALGYKKVKKGQAMGQGAINKVIAAYEKARGIDLSPRLKDYKLTKDSAWVKEVIKTRKETGSTRATAKALGVDRKTVRNILHQFDKELIGEANLRQSNKWNYKKVRAERERELIKRLGGKDNVAVQQYMKLWDDVVDMNEDILEMSDDAIWKNERIRRSMNLDVTGLKSGKGINFDRYKNLSKEEFVAKVKDMASKNSFYKAEHSIPIASEKLSAGFPKNLQVASGKIGDQLEAIKLYIKNNPDGKHIPALNAFLDEFDIQIREGGKTYGWNNPKDKAGLNVFRTDTGTSDIVQSAINKSQTGKLVNKKFKIPVSGGAALHSFPANIPAMWKKLGSGARKTLGLATAGLTELIIMDIDMRNELSKGKSKEEAAAIAKNNATLGIYKNKEYMNQLKKTAEEMGIDSRAFDQVYNLNLTGSKIQNQKEAYKNRIAKLEAMEATNPAAKEKKAKILEEIKLASANFDKDAEKRMSEGIEKVAGQVSISKAAEVFPTPNLDQIADARYDITQEDFAKPFKGLQRSAIEKLWKEKEAAYDMQSKQVHPEAGKYGERLLTHVFTTDALGKIKEKERIDDMLAFDPKELYRYNIARGLHPDAPITQEAYQNLVSDPGLAFNTGGRVPFGKGKVVKGIDEGRRAVLKLLAALGIGTATVGTGILKIVKGSKGVTAIKAGDKIIQGTPGMPDWYIPLINRIVKEGDDVTAKLATKEREIVHTKKISEGEEVTVYQDLDTGNTRVEYNSPDIMGEGAVGPVHLEYKAPEVIDSGKMKGQKTKPEFEAAEAEPVGHTHGPDDYSIEWDGENIVGRVEDLMSDTSKLKHFATKKKPTIKEIVESSKKKKAVQKVHENESDYIVSKQGEAEWDDYLPDIDDIE